MKLNHRHQATAHRKTKTTNQKQNKNGEKQFSNIENVLMFKNETRNHFHQEISIKEFWNKTTTNMKKEWKNIWLWNILISVDLGRVIHFDTFRWTFSFCMDFARIRPFFCCFVDNAHRTSHMYTVYAYTISPMDGCTYRMWNYMKLCRRCMGIVLLLAFHTKNKEFISYLNKILIEVFFFTWHRIHLMGFKQWQETREYFKIQNSLALINKLFQINQRKHDLCSYDTFAEVQKNNSRTPMMAKLMSNYHLLLSKVPL